MAKAADTQIVDKLAQQIGSRAGAGTVFGTPATQGDTTVIPVARTIFGFGGGTDPGTGNRGSEGGGGGAFVKPIGFIQVRNERARYKPIRDPWPFAFATLGLLILARTYTLMRQRTARCPECACRAREAGREAAPTRTAQGA